MVKMDDSLFPQRITVEVTARHLSVPSSASILVRPVTEAIATIAGLTEMPHYQVSVGTDNVTIWGSDRITHDARYWISNGLWILEARHRAGRRVMPGLFEITAMFRRGDENGCKS